MVLENKVAIVTGSGKGIGSVIAKTLYNEGAKVALWDIDPGLVQKLSQTLDPTGKHVLPVEVDVTQEPSVLEGVKQTVAKFGRIDILVNNAGISRHKPIEEMTVELFDQVIAVNLRGTFLCCKSVTPVMKKQQFGKIVNIASLGGRTGRPGVGVNYAASKAGVIGLTQTLARELGPSGIYANAICPGPILTEQTQQYSKEVFATWNAGRAVPKDGYPEDVADAVVFLASNKSDWITGVALDVNGGILIR
ncbi:MAG TPA: SDR family NAD(P)-dependent oxidoreductase [Spirochaetales bacterium]|mgnify:CR=1 FL=1|nr:SDR family NAD(P)-dependent oxidoreductase [Spirochaetales bacterium]